ncbi:hypothetical protein X975_16691, partial [Stegodyphus mimosarum]
MGHICITMLKYLLCEKTRIQKSLDTVKEDECISAEKNPFIGLKISFAKEKKKFRINRSYIY